MKSQTKIAFKVKKNNRKKTLKNENENYINHFKQNTKKLK
jgi:hypothetical protein